MKYKGYNIHQLLTVICIVVNGIGFVIYIAGINVVNCFVIITMLSVVMDLLYKPGGINKLFKGEKKYIVIVFALWVQYAWMQSVFMGVSNDEFSVVFRQLLTNTVFVFFLCYSVNDKKSYDLAVRGLYFICLINTAIGVIEIITDFHFVEPDSVWDLHSTRGLSSNPNEYATTVFLSSLSLLLISFGRRLKKEELLIIPATLACIYTSYSRSLLLAAIIFFVFYFFLRVYFNLSHKRSAILLVSTVTICLIVTLLFTTGIIWQILRYGISKLSSDGDLPSDYYRINLLMDGLHYYSESNGLGVGAGQSITLVGNNLHNLFFEILVEYGWIFLLLIAKMWIAILWNAFNKQLSLHKRSGYFSIIVSMLVASIGSSSILKFKILWIALVLLYISEEYRGVANKWYVEGINEINRDYTRLST